MRIQLLLLSLVACSSQMGPPVEDDEYYLDNSLPPIWKSLSDEEKWDCGSIDVRSSMVAAELLALATCPGFKSEINKACTKHDICYVERRGQEPCDFIFCEDLDNIRGEGGCTVATHTFCNAVKLVGHRFYNDTEKMASRGRRLRQKGIKLDLPRNF